MGQDLSPSTDDASRAPCGRCSDRGWFTTEAAVGAPGFGLAIACTCQGQDRERSSYERLLQYSNLGSLSRFTFAKVKPKSVQVTGSRISYERAYRAALGFAGKPSGWLVIQGPHGSGKTILAAAIGNKCLIDNHVVVFSHVPELLDHLRAAFGPASDDCRWELLDQMKSTPILILDELGNHSTAPWAWEKLGQIVNHRYNGELPTVVTSAIPLGDLDAYLSARLRTPGLSCVVEIEPEQEAPESRCSDVSES